MILLAVESGESNKIQRQRSQAVGKPSQISGKRAAVIGDLRDLVMRGMDRDSLLACENLAAHVSERLAKSGLALGRLSMIERLEQLLVAVVDRERSKAEPWAAVLAAAEAVGIPDPDLPDPPCPAYEKPDSAYRLRLRRAGQLMTGKNGRPITTVRNVRENIDDCLYAFCSRLEVFPIQDSAYPAPVNPPMADGPPMLQSTEPESRVAAVDREARLRVQGEGADFESILDPVVANESRLTPVSPDAPPERTLLNIGSSETFTSPQVEPIAVTSSDCDESPEPDGVHELDHVGTALLEKPPDTPSNPGARELKSEIVQDAGGRVGRWRQAMSNYLHDPYRLRIYRIIRLIAFLLSAILDPVLFLWTGSFPPIVFGQNESIPASIFVSIWTMLSWPIFDLSLLAIGLVILVCAPPVKDGQPLSFKLRIHRVGWAAVSLFVFYIGYANVYGNYSIHQSRIDSIEDDFRLSRGIKVTKNVTALSQEWAPVSIGFNQPYCVGVDRPAPNLAVSTFCNVSDGSLHTKVSTTLGIAVTSYDAAKIAKGEYYFETRFFSGAGATPTLCGLRIRNDAGDFFLHLATTTNTGSGMLGFSGGGPNYAPEILQLHRVDPKASTLSTTQISPTSQLSYLPFINFAPPLVNWSNWHYSSWTKLAVYGEGNLLRFFVDDAEALRVEIGQSPIQLGVAAIAGSSSHGGVTECSFDSLSIRAPDA